MTPVPRRFGEPASENGSDPVVALHAASDPQDRGERVRIASVRRELSERTHEHVALRMAAAEARQALGEPRKVAPRRAVEREVEERGCQIDADSIHDLR